jgi:hypothetical protein
MRILAMSLALVMSASVSACAGTAGRSQNRTSTSSRRIC